MLKKVFLVTFVLLSLSVTAVILYLTDYLNEKIEIPEKIELPKGSITQVVNHLNRNMESDFSIIDAKIIELFGKPQAGELKISRRVMKKWRFLKALTEAKAPPSSEVVTLIPGETTLYFLKIIAEKYSNKFEDIESYYNSISPMKEGFLIPDSYSMNRERDLKKFLLNFVNHSNRVHKKRMDRYGVKSAKEWQRILTVASIVQKESGTVDEMPLVAGVIYNRLKTGMKLQMDGTLNYGLYSHQRVTPKRVREDSSRFNTYKYSGLPPSPVCNPSLKAIEASLHPKESNFLYFVRKKGENSHIFTETYREHLKEIEKLKQ
jgi:UPF0755 protein